MRAMVRKIIFHTIAIARCNCISHCIRIYPLLASPNQREPQLKSLTQERIIYICFTQINDNLKCFAANSGLTCRETTGQPIGEINFPIRSNLFKKAICHSCYIHQQTKKLILRHIILDSWVVLTCICHNDCTYMTIVYLPVTELIGASLNILN